MTKWWLEPYEKAEEMRNAMMRPEKWRITNDWHQTGGDRPCIYRRKAPLSADYSIYDDNYGRFTAITSYHPPGTGRYCYQGALSRGATPQEALSKVVAEKRRILKELRNH